MSSSTITKLEEALTYLHASGLDRRYDDIMSARDAAGADIATMAVQAHYNYRIQAWKVGADHAHIVSNDDTAPLLFCGADITSCIGFEL